jgi:hypothetical protein
LRRRAARRILGAAAPGAARSARRGLLAAAENKNNRHRWNGSTMSMENKRKEERTVIELPLAMENATGVTKNLSSTGMFFWTDSSPAFQVGDRVNITLEVVRSGRKIKPKCQGEIVRVETEGRQCGVALKIVDTPLDMSPK